MEYDGIKGKVAVVTGSGGGIGEAYAKGLAAQGLHVGPARGDELAAQRLHASGISRAWILLAVFLGTLFVASSPPQISAILLAISFTSP